MPGRRNYQPPDRRWLEGSEYGGTQETIAGGIQPKRDEALTPGEHLRLSYMTGIDTVQDPHTLDDRRQFLGLRPADGRRPVWLDHVTDDDNPRLESEARRQGYGEE